MIEEGAVNLLSSESPGPLGEPSVWHLHVPVLYNDMETHLCFLRNFSNVIHFNRRQCVPVSNYVSDVDHSVCVLCQLKFSCFIKEIGNAFILFCGPAQDNMELELE